MITGIEACQRHFSVGEHTFMYQEHGNASPIAVTGLAYCEIEEIIYQAK